MEVINPEIELIKDPKPDQRCSFCFSAVNNPLRYGDMYKYKNIMAHYFCVLMSSQLQQNGEDREGFFGFLINDLKKELDRAKSVKCCFCKRGGATAQCNIKVRYKQKCTNSFHFTCGITHGTLHYFFGKFQSLCHLHRRPQKIPEEFIKDSATQCWICHDVIQDVNSGYSSLWAACCKKSYFHKDCVQHQAYVSGEYHFKCPLCNNHEKFKQAMLRCGIFLPIRDAEWEREPNAYSDLYQEHNSCDTEPCLCPHIGKDGDSRKYNSGAWDLIRCSTCGSEGTHRPCSGLPLKGDVSWNCATCRQVIINQQKQANSGAGTSLVLPEIEPKNIEPDTCCADFCTCNKGREYRADKGMYRTIYCGDCEYSWIHSRCLNAQSRGINKGEWICVGCELSDSEEADPPAATSSRAPVASTPSAEQQQLTVEEKTKKQVSSPCHVVLLPMSSKYFFKSISHLLSRSAYFKMRYRERQRQIMESLETNEDSGLDSFSKTLGNDSASEVGRIDGEQTLEFDGTDSMFDMTAQTYKEGDIGTLKKGDKAEGNESSLPISIQSAGGEARNSENDESQDKREAHSTEIVVTAEIHTEPVESKLTGYESSMFSVENLKRCILNNFLRSLSPLKAVHKSDGMKEVVGNQSKVQTIVDNSEVNLTARRDTVSDVSTVFVQDDRLSETPVKGENLLDLVVKDKINNHDKSKVVHTETQVNGIAETAISNNEVSAEIVKTNELSDSGISEMKENVDVSNNKHESVCDAQDDLPAIAHDKDITDKLCKMYDKGPDDNIDTINSDSLKDHGVLDHSINNVVDSFENNNNRELDEINVPSEKQSSCNTMDVDLDITVHNNVDLCQAVVKNCVGSRTKKKKNLDLKNKLVVGHKKKVSNIKHMTRKSYPSLCSERKCVIYDIHHHDAIIDHTGANEKNLTRGKYESESVVNKVTLKDDINNIEAKVAKLVENKNEHEEYRKKVNVLEIEFPLKYKSIVKPEEGLLKRSKCIVQYETEEDGIQGKTVMLAKYLSKSDMVSKKDVTEDAISDSIIIKEHSSVEQASLNNFSNDENDLKMEVDKTPDGKVQSKPESTNKQAEPFTVENTVELNSNLKRIDFNIENELVNFSHSFKRPKPGERKNRPKFLKAENNTEVCKTEGGVNGKTNIVQPGAKTMDPIKVQLNCNVINKIDVTMNGISQLVSTNNEAELGKQVDFGLLKKSHKGNETDENVEMNKDSDGEKVQNPVSRTVNQFVTCLLDNSVELKKTNKIIKNVSYNKTESVDKNKYWTRIVISKNAKIKLGNERKHWNKKAKRRLKLRISRNKDVEKKIMLIKPETKTEILHKEQSSRNTINESIISKEEIGLVEKNVSVEKTSSTNRTDENVDLSVAKTPDDKNVNQSKAKSSDKYIRPLSTKKIYEYFTCTQSRMILHNDGDSVNSTDNVRPNTSNIGDISRNLNERKARKRNLFENISEEPRRKRQRLSQLPSTPYKDCSEEDQKQVIAKQNSNKKQIQMPWKRHSKSATKEDTTSRKIYEFFSVQNPVTLKAKMDNNIFLDDDTSADNKATESFLVSHKLKCDGGNTKPTRKMIASDVTDNEITTQLETKETLPGKIPTCADIKKPNKDSPRGRNSDFNGPHKDSPRERNSDINPPNKLTLKEGCSDARNMRRSTRRSSLMSILSNSDAKAKDHRILRRRGVQHLQSGDENFSPNKMAYHGMGDQSPSLKRASKRLSEAKKDLSLFL